MAIEYTPGVGTTITGEHINLYRLMALASALGLEINTGMKIRSGVSTMQVAAKACGSTKRTKKGVLADLVTFTAGQFPQYTPNPSVAKALGR